MTKDSKDTNMNELISAMVGRSLDNRFPPVDNTPGETILSVQGLSTKYAPKLQNITFDVKKGEIFGLYGLVGAGRTELLETIFGIRTRAAGNVIFGKWLERSPNVFMMDDPTRGIDVGAKYEIYELIINMAKQGKTIIVVSSEMPEILGITNRIGVMSNGHLAGIVNTKETNQEELLRLSAKYL